VTNSTVVEHSNSDPLYKGIFRVILYCKTPQGYVLHIYRPLDSSQAYPQASLNTGQLKRFEAVIYKNRIFLSYLTTSGFLYYTKSLVSVDQDTSISPGVFNYFTGITSFDLMMDAATDSISGIKAILYNQVEKRVILLEFSSTVDYSTRTVARTAEELIQVSCADDFKANLTCLGKKTSGDVCIFRLMLGQSQPQAELSCRVQNYYDFDSKSIGVLDSQFLFVFGQSTTKRFRGFIFYRVNSNTSLPILPSGSLDLNFSTVPSETQYSVSNSNSVMPGLLICIQNQEGIQFYQVRNISLNVSTPDVSYAVVRSNHSP
jgi:hypothetical protein